MIGRTFVLTCLASALVIGCSSQHVHVKQPPSTTTTPPQASVGAPTTNPFPPGFSYTETVYVNLHVRSEKEQSPYPYILDIRLRRDGGIRDSWHGMPTTWDGVTKEIREGFLTEDGSVHRFSICIVAESWESEPSFDMTVLYNAIKQAQSAIHSAGPRYEEVGQVDMRLEISKNIDNGASKAPTSQPK